jgi:hypothetical protein
MRLRSVAAAAKPGPLLVLIGALWQGLGLPQYGKKTPKDQWQVQAVLFT